MLPSAMREKRGVAAVLACAGALAALAATELLPARVGEVARAVEEVRGRRFERPVPASEIATPELKRILRQKLVEGFPASPEETLRSVAALGLIEDSPGLLDRLVDFYASQVIAFYDPEPRRFFVVAGADGLADLEEESAGISEQLIFSHELTHALQDEALRLDERARQLREDGDRALALQCVLEGEATLVMVRVALREMPGASEALEEQLAPLLSAGTLEQANVPNDMPRLFVDQLFFPYVDGTAYVRAAVAKGGWAEMDRLWRNPPQSTSEIIHGVALPPPASGLLPSSPAALAPAGSRLLYTDTQGEWTIRFLLRRALAEPEADRAAAGWRGDRIAFFAGPAGPIAYVWRLRYEDVAAASRFEAAFRKARAARPVHPSELIARSGADVVIASGFAKLPELPGWAAAAER